MKFVPVKGRRNVFSAYRRLGRILQPAGPSRDGWWTRHDKYRLLSIFGDHGYAADFYGATFDVSTRAEDDPHYAVHMGFDPGGLNRRVSGQFLWDEQRYVYLAHSGKIGGARKGIGKATFFAMYRGDNIVQAKWPGAGGRASEFVILGRIDSPRLLAHISYVVHEIARIKKAVDKTRRIVTKVKVDDVFNPEFYGRRATYEPKGAIEASCDHGIVVNRLRSAIVDRIGIEPKNRKTRDLFITDSRGRVTVLFEVKTDLLTGSTYTAVGQLLLNGAAERTMPKLVLVVPGNPSARTSEALSRLNVRVLSYEWKGEEPSFSNLGEALK
jgi:hypothetical protein